MHDQLPTLDAGVTHLDGGRRALYRLVGAHLADDAGPAHWLDAGNVAAPDALYRHASRRACRGLQVARAFTGYQHYELARGLVRHLRERTRLVVAPNVDLLYADDDVPAGDADAMAAATLELLAAVATAVSAPVLVTDAGTDLASRVREAADRTLDAERTDAGLRVEGPDFRSQVYWHDWGFQTTIPHWVALARERPIAPAERPRPTEA